MASTDKKIGFTLPGDEIADTGTLRLGSGMITAGFPALRGEKARKITTAKQKRSPVTAEFPQLRLPNREIADTGLVRLGSGMITAIFPAKLAPTRRSTRS